MSAVESTAPNHNSSAWFRGTPPHVSPDSGGHVNGQVTAPISIARNGSLLVSGGDLNMETPGGLAFGTVNSETPMLSSSPAVPSMTGAHLDSAINVFGSVPVQPENGDKLPPKQNLDVHSLFISRPKIAKERRESASQAVMLPPPGPYMSNGPRPSQIQPRSPVPSPMSAPYPRPMMQARPGMPMQRPMELPYAQGYAMGFPQGFYGYQYNMPWNPMAQQAVANPISPRGPQPSLPQPTPDPSTLPNSIGTSPRPTPPSRTASILPTPPHIASMRPPASAAHSFTPSPQTHLSVNATAFTPRKPAVPVKFSRPDGTTLDVNVVAKDVKEPKEKKVEQAGATPKRQLPSLPIIVRPPESEEQKRLRLDELAQEAKIRSEVERDEQEREERRQRAEAKAKEEAAQAEAKIKAEVAVQAEKMKAEQSIKTAALAGLEVERNEAELRKETDDKEAELKTAELKTAELKTAELKEEMEGEDEPLHTAPEANASASQQRAAGRAPALISPVPGDDSQTIREVAAQPLLPPPVSASPLPSPRLGSSTLPPKPVSALSRSSPSQATSPTSSTIVTAAPILNLSAITYPSPNHPPNPDLNKDAQPGKFRYDRDFLLQFMNICTEKPANLPKLGEIGLEADASSGFGRKRSTAGSARPVGLGMTRPLPSQGMGTFNMGNMGSFASGPLRAADRNRPSRVPSQGPLTPMISRGVARGSQRGTRRQPPPPADDASPLVVSANSWSAQRPSNDEGSPAYVERKVKALLNKLTAEKFDSIAQQILEWANKSEHETDGTSLKLVIKLVFEKATDEAHWSQMYARLCRLILERLNPNVSETVEDGKVISGGVLFRRYLIGRCQVDFENGWKAREDTATAAAARSEEDKQQLANREGDEAPMLSDEYYAAQKAKRRGLGLVQLIGELYKLEMISRNVIRQCLRRLLGNLDSPDEEDIESTCKLLTTIGGQYDEVEKDNMDVIFDRLSVILKGDKLPSRIRFMIMDVFDLRRSGWQSRKPQSSVMTIAEVHEQAAREQAEKSAALSRDAISRGGSRAGGRRDGPQTGEWQNVPTGRPPQRPTDFSNLGKLSSQTMPNAPSFTGPSGIFARKGKTSLVTPPMSRQASTADLSNKFNVLSGEAADKAEPKQEEPQRKKITLKPRTKPMPNEEAEAGEVKDEAKEMETTSDEESGMSEQQALDKIELDMKELWGDKGLIGTRNPSDIVEYFRALPTQHHLLLATRLLDHLFRTQKTKDGEIIASGWKKSIEERVISPELLLKSVESRISTLDDDAVDFPAAYKAVALLVRSIAASPDDLERLVSLIIVEGTPRLTPRMKWEKALREVDEASA